MSSPPANKTHAQASSTSDSDLLIERPNTSGIAAAPGEDTTLSFLESFLECCEASIGTPQSGTAQQVAPAAEAAVKPSGVTENAYATTLVTLPAPLESLLHAGGAIPFLYRFTDAASADEIRIACGTAVLAVGWERYGDGSAAPRTRHATVVVTGRAAWEAAARRALRTAYNAAVADGRPHADLADATTVQARRWLWLQRQTTAGQNLIFVDTPEALRDVIARLIQRACRPPPPRFETIRRLRELPEGAAPSLTHRVLAAVPGVGSHAAASLTAAFPTLPALCAGLACPADPAGTTEVDADADATPEPSPVARCAFRGARGTLRVLPARIVQRLQHLLGVNINSAPSPHIL